MVKESGWEVSHILHGDRSDFYKFLDVIKHDLTQEEYVAMVKKYEGSSLDILKKILKSKNGEITKWNLS